jgi:competence protein ComEC
MTRRTRFFLFILAAIFLISIALFLFSPKSEKNLEVIFLDVGQGDSILIKSPFGQKILIDGGPDNSVLSGLGKELTWWDRKIDLMILTHPHDDHVTGLIGVLKRYKVEKILYTGTLHNSPNYLKWLEVIKEKKIHLVIADKKQKIILGEDLILEIIYPDKNFLNKHSPNLNNTSIVARLIHEKNSFLFTGDIEEETELELVGKNIDLGANVLKVAHHGSDTSSLDKFLKAVSPKIAIILVGEDNNFDFPSRRVLRRLEENNIKILRTDIDGTIGLISDGERIYRK